jgi:hypothetical protein
MAPLAPMAPMAPMAAALVNLRVLEVCGGGLSDDGLVHLTGACAGRPADPLSTESTARSVRV